MNSTFRIVLLGFVIWSVACAAATAQLAPEIGYLSPAGVQSGATTDVVLGGYDWTEDMQIFVHDPRVTLELVGTSSPVLISEPPYWFGAKARGYAWPLPREFRARLTVPADVKAGLIRWQVANANGVSPSAVIHVSEVPHVMEDPDHQPPQELFDLPVIVSGQIRRIEEVDHYIIRPRNSGLVTIQLLARQLTSPTNPMSLHGVLQVRDDDGVVVVDCSDSEGNDLTTTFPAQQGRAYSIRLHDLDFAGDRSYVYRLLIHPGPQVLAAYPSAGKRGDRLSVRFVGQGLRTGSAVMESISREVEFPSDPALDRLDYVLETPFGKSIPYSFILSDLDELAEGVDIGSLPAAVTGALNSLSQGDSYRVPMRQGDVWQISARNRAMAMGLDLELIIVGPDGRELSTVDDVPGSTDPELTFAVPEDGDYQISVVDRSGHHGTDAAAYRLSIERPSAGIRLTVPERLSIPLGTTGKLPVAIAREGGYQGPVLLRLTGLPEGISIKTELLIPEMQSERVIELECAAETAVKAGLVKVSAVAMSGENVIAHAVQPVVVAMIMTPRIKITPEGLDDVSKVRRGSTHLFPLLIDRLDGFTGEITLEMTAKQQRHRQGLASDEFVVAAGERRVEYPIFVPEWMETTKTSRMILNGAVRVNDPAGNPRTLLQKMELRLGILPEGAILKLSHKLVELRVSPGDELVVPLNVSCLPEFHEVVRVELVPTQLQKDRLHCQPVTLQPGETEARMVVRFVDDRDLTGLRSLKFRADAHQAGKWLVRSETEVPVECKRPVSRE